MGNEESKNINKDNKFLSTNSLYQNANFTEIQGKPYLQA